MITKNSKSNTNRSYEDAKDWRNKLMEELRNNKELLRMGEDSTEEDPGSDSNPSDDNLSEIEICKLLSNDKPKITFNKKIKEQRKEVKQDIKKIQNNVASKVRLSQRNKVCKTPSLSKVQPIFTLPNKVNSRTVLKKALAPLIIKSIPIFETRTQLTSDSFQAVGYFNKKNKRRNKLKIVNIAPSKSLEALRKDTSISRLEDKYNKFIENIISTSTKSTGPLIQTRWNGITNAFISSKHTIYMPRKKEEVFPSEFYNISRSR